jgi:thiol:disulfide interchange protein
MMLALRRPLPGALAFGIIFLAGCGGDATPEGAATTATVPSSEVRVARGRIQFIDGYTRGSELARREGRPMLVFFTAAWCDYCHQMANEAFTEDQVVRLSRRFVCILVDADREPDVCHDFRVHGYPTIQFLSPGGLPLNRVTGKRPGRQLVVEMQAALQAVARRPSRIESPAVY